MNRVLLQVAKIQERIDALTDIERDGLNDGMTVTAEEHFGYQNAQARAFATGKITHDEAMVIYMALGEFQSGGNGGWTAQADLATKVTVTKIVGELLGVRS